ncbi:MAG TPA: YihY/virulence factor BrkB family protein [Phycisphaerae bacterium]|nr:YihY/virulence factor BrkB family protein [Phycisphaerae bacterium]
MRLRTAWTILRDTIKALVSDECLRMSAAVSYYTLLSLAPLLIIIVAVAGFWWNVSTTTEALVDEMNRLIGAPGAEVVKTILQNAGRSDQGLTVGIVGLATLLFGATAVFRSLQDAMNTIWNVQPRHEKRRWSFFRKRLLSMAMVAAVGFLLLVSLVVTMILAAIRDYISSDWMAQIAFWQILNSVVSTVTAGLLFAGVFKYLPDVGVPWREVLLGAGITAILFTLGKSLFGIYVGSTGIGQAYGAAGSIVVFLVWVYYSAVILFVGAELTKVLARVRGSTVEPAAHAQWLTQPLNDQPQK